MPTYHALDALFDLQTALKACLESDELRGGSASAGSFLRIRWCC
jgi:hypothetical protein